MAKEGIKLQPKIMIPLVGHVNELTRGAPPARGGGQGDRERGWRQGGVQVRHDDRAAARRADRRADRRGGRVLQLRHQRPDADDLRHQPRRRRGQVPAAIRRGPGRAGTEQPVKILQDQPVPDARPRRRGPAGAHRRRGGPRGQSRTWRWASAASTAATPTASPSATRSASTTSAARRSACPWRGWPPRRPRWPQTERDK